MNVSKRRSLWPLVIATAALVVVAVIVLVGADPVMAASGTGQKVGNEVSSWGKALILGVIGLVGIPVIAKLDFAKGIALVLLAVVVGGFILAPGEAKDVITGFWQAIKP